MVPSFDPDAPGFDARRYWRGPVWYVVNNRIGLGLREIGELDRSERIRRDTAALSEATGFSEYYDPSPETGWAVRALPGRRRSIWTGPANRQAPAPVVPPPLQPPGRAERIETHV